MSVFVPELGARLLERWAWMLALPGLLFLAAAATAATLGQSHALDAARLEAGAAGLARGLARDPVTWLAAVALAAAAAGLVARAAGAGVERLWYANRPRFLTVPLADRRRRRWHAADRALCQAERLATETPAAHAARRAALAQARNRIALCEPARPTWIADRLRGAGVRVRNQYGFDLGFAWPRLWLLLPEPARAELRAARNALAAAAVEVGWSLMWLALGVRWWPAAVAGAAVGADGWLRARAAAAALADLAEAAADLHGGTLAAALGIDRPAGPVTTDVGRAIDERLRKGA